MSGDDGDEPGSVPYAGYRTVIDDPALREELLRRVRATVGALRSAYRWHAVLALVAILVLVAGHPGGLTAAWRPVLLAAAVLVDLLALVGAWSAATAPARWLLPLLAVDLLVAVGLPVLAAIRGEFHVLWLAFLLLPAMLVLRVRDARSLAPLLAEHARRRRAEGKPRP